MNLKTWHHWKLMIRTIEKRKEVLKELKQILNSRLIDFSSPIFANINWVDPKNWNISTLI